MSRCPENTEWVLYAAGELPAGRRSALEAHLEACATCRREADVLWRGLAAMEVLDRDAPLRPEAMETLKQRLATLRSSSSASLRSTSRAAATHRPARRPIVLVLWHYRWAAAAAVLVAAVMAWSLIYTPTVVIPRVASTQAPAPVEIQWQSDAVVQEEMTEIAAGVEMLEGSENGQLCEADPGRPDTGNDDSLDETDQMLEMLQTENAA